jgi:hypothetical protein
MMEDTPTPLSAPKAKIIGYEFSGDVCKIEVQAHTQAQLTDPATKRAVYEYRHTIGASHMGLNKFEPAYTPPVGNDSSVSTGYWYLRAGL